ncbi:uncharacterized protein LOC131674545 isoform X2 [Phymastichus coffea]|uniref:uncharacterized protein LOC131674545 isoform X2 n=1 Tax=Phymastichus coffea TaxID=108790 RepID=UPI00273B4C02|nr:uncharacterized protein LOC131674545 isoform X2 [Phymastichus coffea]
MASVSTAGKIKVLWKRGWIKMPEIMVSTAGALIGICLSIGTYLYKDSHHGWNQKYVSRYMGCDTILNSQFLSRLTSSRGPFNEHIKSELRAKYGYLYFIYADLPADMGDCGTKTECSLYRL